jgi:hypothetical protein
VCTRFGDRLDDTGALNLLEPIQFLTQRGFSGFCHWKPVHA